MSFSCVLFLSNGSTSYTIGSGGDIDTIRPSAIFTAYYTLGGLDYPLQVLDYKTYSEIGTKNIGAIPEYVGKVNAAGI